ncbi:toll/interleukin-1 receptor domain-containing protein [Lentzea sp. NPDC059081]|uniref:toll/interleukin-1 receptor domain-containing protein n=1 Tax=Lentzea sp. NPDC059081 TaxID=3346719 RepID=UPI0036D14246
MEYNAFISYNQGQDLRFAAALQAGLTRFAVPWWKSSDLRICLDRTDLAQSSALWPSIEKKLAASDWLVLLASPGAARSRWVDREIEWWLANRSPERLLIVWTDGALVWNGSEYDATVRGNALPPRLAQVFSDEPNVLDLRKCRQGFRRRWPHRVWPRFGETVGATVAAIRGVEPRHLLGQHGHYQRQLRRTVRSVGVALAVLLVAATVAGVKAVERDAEATRQRDVALSRQFATQSDALLATDPTSAQRLAVAAWQVSHTDEAAYSARNAMFSRQRAVFTAEPGFSDAVFTAAGDRLVTVGAEGSMVVFDVASRAEVGRIATGHQGWISDLAISATGDYLATAGEDHTVRIWDARTWTQSGRTIRVEDEKVRTVEFSPDGQMLASADNRETVSFWSVRTQEPVGDPIRTGSDITDIAFDRSGRLLATAGRGGVQMWDVTTRSKAGPFLKSAAHDVETVAFSPIADRLITGDDDSELQVWDSTTGGFVTDMQTGHSTYVRDVLFSPDGRVFATVGGEEDVMLWDANTGKRLSLPLSGHTGLIGSMAFSPDGTALVTVGNDDTTRVWEVHSNLAVRAFPGKHDGFVHEVVFSPDGEVVASAGADGTVRLWSAKNNSPIGEPLRGDFQEASDVAFSPDGRRVAAATHEGTVVEWNVDTHELTGPIIKANFHGDHGEWVDSLLYARGGELIISAGHDGKVRFWSSSSHQEQGRPLDIGHGQIFGTALHPNGVLLAIGNADGTTGLWDIDTRLPAGDPLSEADSSNAIRKVAFSPDGNTLAAAGSDGTVRLWDVRSRTSIGDPLADNAHDVRGVAFSPDSTMLAAGSGDGRIRLWDIKTRKQFSVYLAEHAAAVTGVAFTGDGTRLASSSWDKTVRLWDMGDQASPVRTICAFRDELTPDEWTRYTANEPHRNTCRG